MGMTKSQRALQIVCIVGIVLNAIAAILTLGAAVISTVGLNAPGVDLSGAVNGTINGQAMTAGQALGILGIISAIAGILYVLNVVACILGLRGAKDPSKIRPFFNIVVVLVILQAVVIALNTMYGDISSNRLFTLLFNIILLFLANQVKQQA